MPEVNSAFNGLGQPRRPSVDEIRLREQLAVARQERDEAVKARDQLGFDVRCEAARWVDMSMPPCEDGVNEWLAARGLSPIVRREPGLITYQLVVTYAIREEVGDDEDARRIVRDRVNMDQTNVERNHRLYYRDNVTDATLVTDSILVQRRSTS